MRLLLVIRAAVLAAGLSSCEFTHTNPFDPATPIDLTIVGPDTLFTLSQVSQYTIESTPSFTDPTAEWGSSDGYSVRGGSSGSFLLYAAPLYPETEVVTVSVGIGHYNLFPLGAFRRSFSRTIVITQRLVKLQLRCPSAHACDALGVGGVWSVWVDGLDAGGSPVFGFTDPATNLFVGAPIATFVVRDTTIVTAQPLGVRVATVTARKPGTTWIVGARGQVSDSLQLVVH